MKKNFLEKSFIKKERMSILDRIKIWYMSYLIRKAPKMFADEPSMEEKFYRFERYNSEKK